MYKIFKGAPRRNIAIGVIAAALLPIGLLTTTSVGATTPTVNAITLTSPAIPNVSPPPGPTAATFTTGPSIGVLAVSPQEGAENTPMTISGSGLPANAKVQLLWSTDNMTWVADVEPNTANYLGTSTSGYNVILTTVTASASGSFTYGLKAPTDFGGTHSIYAVVNGVELAQGGFTLMRTLTVTPRSGPIGTPITITYTGMGASLYAGGAAMLWDNHYTGEMMANWTRGTASFTIRAAGPVGTHVITVADAIGDQYLNIMQSPLPYAHGFTVTFDTTKDNGPPASSVDYPASVTPTVSQVTTENSVGLNPASNAVETITPTSGPVDTKVTVKVSGLSESGTDQLVWSSVQGSRVNCTSTCWVFTTSPLGSATVTNGTLSAQVTIPDGLGGWHVIQVMNGTSAEAQVPFYVKESIIKFTNKNGSVASMGIESPNDVASASAIDAGGYNAINVGTPTYQFKEGQEFTINLNGLGWTQFDNTLAVDYDNSYVGYGCGFNSSGYTVIHMHATGDPGTHIIDLYPMLYSLSPSYDNTPYGMNPVLTAARDYPALALGYQIPVFHFAIRIVK